MEKIVESLHTLRVIHNLIKKYIDGLIEIEKQDSIFHAVKSQILVLANSYLDEWDKYLKPDKPFTEQSKLLICAKKKSKPAIVRIKKWKGLKSIRNAVLAHNLRDKSEGYRSVFLSDKFDDLDFPDHITEIVLLSDLIEIVTKIVCEPFTEEIEKTKATYFSVKNREIKGVDTRKEIEQVLIEIESISC